ncbi:MAG: hypothetical protein IKU37_06415 [Candidatus Gastranaerophilales bacterium]|nr:hypothetical protein [Candidatus Gastranaerophilales bacterium]
MKKQVYAYLHTHWDREWYRDKEDFNLRLLDVLDIILDELKQNKAPFFYLDGQTIALLDYLKYRPEKEKEIISLIKEHKLAIGPYFVSADSYLVNFISMLKNLDLGMEISNKYGQKEFIGYLSDIFGVSNSIFEALKLKNIDKSLVWRGVNPKKIKNNCNFIKNNIKTTWLIQGYFNDFLHNGNIDGLKNYLDKISKYSQNILLLPIGADHLGILQDANKKIALINSELKDYEIILSSPFEYFKQTKHQNITKEQEFLDNSNTFILSGVYSARIPQKIKNNEIQNELTRKIEPLNFYLKENYQINIDEIYKTLIKNHAHDGIYGCSLDSVADSVDSRFDKCQLAINALEKKLIGNFKKKNNIKNQSINKIGLFNLSNSKIKTVEVKLPYILPNSQILKIEQGFSDELLYDCYKIPVTENITKIYTQLIEISKNNNYEFSVVNIKKPIKKIKISNTSIENNFIKLNIKNNKINILNKKTKEKFELKLTDIKDGGDSYNFAPIGNYKEIKFLKSEIEYDGKIQSSLKLHFENIELSAILDNNSDFIKFKSKINNKKENHKIQLVLFFNEKITQTIAQDAIGIIKRKINPNYKMQDFIPAKRPTELKTNSFPMQNFVCANKIIALTKGLHEYEIYQNQLRICLLRGFSTISNPKNPARSIPAGPDLKTPKGQVLGINEAEFILSFGNYKKAFKIVDNLFKNYIIIDGEFNKNTNYKLDKIPNNSFLYGINKGKKIIYNYKENKINMI